PRHLHSFPTRRSSDLMERLHPAGLFETVLPDRREPFAYRLEVTRDGHVAEIDDPYRFPSLLSDFDRHLLAQGTHYRAHERLGAQDRKSTRLNSSHRTI